MSNATSMPIRFTNRVAEPGGAPDGSKPSADLWQTGQNSGRASLPSENVPFLFLRNSEDESKIQETNTAPANVRDERGYLGTQRPEECSLNTFLSRLSPHDGRQNTMRSAIRQPSRLAFLRLFPEGRDDGLTRVSRLAERGCDSKLVENDSGMFNTRQA